ncbi:MAG: serine/threonine-protein kinase [Polyangiaceae bacterium]|jgi:serine/threonine-protein kinase
MMSTSNVLATSKDGPEHLPERIGPYTIYGEIGAGGMGSVHLGQLDGAAGFSRVVAIKRMHVELARSPQFVEMFLQESRLVGRIQHPNVVAAFDCVTTEDNAMLVMEYVHGVSLSQLAHKPIGIPLSAASAIVLGAALGLHAAHEGVGADGKSLGIVHRDVSPQNILVGVDGLARVLDFGIAKAAARSDQTPAGEIKGKLSYMAPEQLLGEEVGRAADIYSLGVILWELVTGRRLFATAVGGQMTPRIAQSLVASPRTVNPRVSPEVSAIIMKAVAASPQARYRTALEFAAAVERTMPVMAQRTLGAWVADVASDELAHNAKTLSQIDARPSRRVPSREAYTKPCVAAERRTSRCVVEDGLSARTGTTAIARPSGRPPLTRWMIGASACAVALLVAIVAIGSRPQVPPSDPENTMIVASVSVQASPSSAPSTPVATRTAPNASPQDAPSSASRVRSLSAETLDAGLLFDRQGRQAPRPPLPRWRSIRPRTRAPTTDLDLGLIGGRE